MDFKKLLVDLSAATGIGNISYAADVAEKYLSKYGPVEKLGPLGRAFTIKGNSNYTILIDAHIDQIGFIVTDIDENGFLTVKNCGGIDLRHLFAKPVTIHAKKDVMGVFVSTPPHLSKQSPAPENISDIKIDTGLGSSAKEIISVGDFVTFRGQPIFLNDNTICSKSLDNRAGVAAAIMLVDRLFGKTLNANVMVLLSDAEELGLRGAATAIYGKNIDEAVVIDVSFGDGPDIPKESCGKLGQGAMVGISPIFDKRITDRLTKIPKDNNLPYQLEIMGGKTSTNADVITISEKGVATGLLSIPLRNMHTDTEIVNISDIISVVDILEEYILTGGCMNV